ncbi:MAG: NUDIX hydrolase, partial [Planctomycetota bacterium]
LPAEFTYTGDCSAGEIEIVTDEGAAADVGIVYENKRMMVVVDPVVFPPDRSPGTYQRVIEKAQLNGIGGTIIVPIVDQNVVFVELFRHSTRRWEWEVPRGYQEPGLSPEENAMKETNEEIGVMPLRVQELGPITPNTGLLSSETTAFAAFLPNGCVDELRGQHSESIRETRALNFSELDPFILNHVRCGFSLSALLLARIHGLLG